MISLLILFMEVLQLVIAAVASIVFFVFAGVTLAGSAVALTVTTPLFIIFSPILVPATIATAVLATGFTASGTLGAMAVALIRRGMGGKPKKYSPNGEKRSLALSGQNLFQMLKFSGGYGGSWGGKSFSGTFGDKSAGGAAPAGGSNPFGGFGGSFDGKSFSGLIPGLLGALAGGSTPAAGAKPPGGAKPAAGAKPIGSHVVKEERLCRQRNNCDDDGDEIEFQRRQR
ncbi:Tapetal oleosin GRP-17 [Cardamine amara subsp. amara]|uniref:Tapetal oleosin GRP-17 n=1 Tax=Cardamine amara subsp. amara TaxID=228776 RepID=A0ABD0ZQS6_CARAN